MDFIGISVLALGLSMDSFAVSLTEGVLCRKWRWDHIFKMAGILAFFQALMPLIGWLLGWSVQAYIERYDHWIAFGLLAFLGGKMVMEALATKGVGAKDVKTKDEIRQEDVTICRASTTKNMLLLGMATSIDALAAGISLACLEMSASHLIWALVMIFAITFICSLAGQAIGLSFGARLKTWSTLAGGLMLMAIGLKILLEHLTMP